jgi:urease accessory protein
MELIHDHLHHWNESLPRIPVLVDRLTLAKRRWRATAKDGTDFGFDLESPLENGDIFHETSAAVHVIEQKPEPVLEFALGETPAGAARLGWLFGNLHFPIQITDDCVRVVDDPAVLRVGARDHLRFHASEQIFTPLAGSAGHGHGHHHH